MSELREAIESGRQTYHEARFPGDLGDLAMAEPKRRSWRLATIGGFTVAASLAAIAALAPEEAEPPSLVRPQVAQTRSALDVPRTTAKPPKLLDQMARVSSTPVAKKRLPKLRLSKFDPLAYRPPTAKQIAAMPVPVGPSPSAPSGKRPLKPRKRDLSNPSLAFRSMNDAISLGT